MPLAAASAVCTDSLTYGWHFSLFVVVSCSVICSLSVCLVIIILTAPKSLYQHGGDAGALWTASNHSKLFRVCFDSKVSEQNSSLPIKWYFFGSVSISTGGLPHWAFQAICIATFTWCTSSHQLSITSSNTSAKKACTCRYQSYHFSAARQHDTAQVSTWLLYWWTSKAFLPSHPQVSSMGWHLWFLSLYPLLHHLCCRAQPGTALHT